MGYKAMEWVWDNYAGSSGSDKLVLLRIAYHVDDKTGVGFPSVDTISKKVNRSDRQVQSVIKSLRERGIIQIDEGGGRLSNTYHLLGYIASLQSQTFHPTYEAHFTPEMSERIQTNTIHTKPTSPHLRSGQHPTYEVGNTPPTKPTSPEHTYNINSNTIEEPKPIKINVAPVGDDTTQTHLPESTQSPQPTQSGNVSMSQSSEPTGTTDQLATPVSVAVEGMQTNSDTTKRNSKPSSKTTPPVVPPADTPKVRSLSDHQLMVSAIAKVFAWNFVTLTKSNKKLLGKVASELREAGATPDDIPKLYAYCKNQNWDGKFTPMALSSQWANFVAEKANSSASKGLYQTENGMIFPVYVPPADYKPIFDYSLLNVAIDPQGDVTNITPEESVDGIKNMIDDLAKRMEVVVTDLDPNDPMNEVLPW